MSNIVTICEAESCEDEAIFNIPTHLCREHWVVWWTHNAKSSDEALEKTLSGDKDVNWEQYYLMKKSHAEEDEEEK